MEGRSAERPNRMVRRRQTQTIHPSMEGRSAERPNWELAEGSPGPTAFNGGPLS